MPRSPRDHLPIRCSRRDGETRDPPMRVLLSNADSFYIHSIRNLPFFLEVARTPPQVIFILESGG